MRVLKQILAAGSSAGNSDNNLKEQTQRMLSGKKVLLGPPRHVLAPCVTVLCACKACIPASRP